MQRLLETAVHRVDGVDCPQLRRDMVGLFVAVVPLKGEAVFPHAQMGMRVHKPWIQPRALRVNHLFPRFWLHGHAAQFCNLVPLCAKVTVRYIRACHCVQMCMDDQHGTFLLITNRRPRPPEPISEFVYSTKKRSACTPLKQCLYLDWP